MRPLRWHRRTGRLRRRFWGTWGCADMCFGCLALQEKNKSGAQVLFTMMFNGTLNVTFRQTRIEDQTSFSSWMTGRSSLKSPYVTLRLRFQNRRSPNTWSEKKKQQIRMQRNRIKHKIHFKTAFSIDFNNKRDYGTPAFGKYRVDGVDDLS